MDPRLLKDIEDGERCELTAYKDTKGLWTVGWGHLLDQSIDWHGYAITQAQADAWRDADITKAIAAAQRLPEWTSLDTDCRRNALYELIFNMGAGHWIPFVETRGAMVNQNWQRAHDELLRSKWHAEVHDTRANRIANYILTGQYPVV